MCIKDYLKNNPYRVLGVATNDSSATLVSHNSQMKAYASIGKSVSFAHDLDMAFGEKPQRQSQDLASALAALSTPEGRLHHSMFWFMNVTVTDAEALAALAKTGSAMEARRIWEKGEQDMSSVQNQLMCNLLMDPRAYAKAIQNAFFLYARFGGEFITTVSGGISVTTPDQLMSLFMMSLIDVSGKEIKWWDRAMRRCHHAPLTNLWIETKARSLIKKLQEVLNAARSSECKTPQDHYDIASHLMHQAEPFLKELKELTDQHFFLLSSYTTIADTLCEFILDEQITYYNRSGWSYSKADRVLPLKRFCYRYAATVRFKNRCKETINIVLGRKKDAPLFPNGTPDNLMFESDRKRRSAGICAILTALEKQKTEEQ